MRNSRAAMRGLISRAKLDGQHELRTVLRPERPARPIAINDIPGLVAEIERACQAWGGGGNPLLPVSGSVIDPAYQRLLEKDQFDFVGGLQAPPALDLPDRVGTETPLDYPAFVLALAKPWEERLPVEVCDLEPNDPWGPIYAAALGLIPDTVASSLTERFDLREGIEYAEIFELRRVAVAGSLEDLVARVGDRKQLTPRRFSNLHLAWGMNADASVMSTTRHPVVPRDFHQRRLAGPNIVVACSPGSVEDLVLLWNLRAAHGDHTVLPLGLPLADVTPSALRYLQEPGRAVMFGWSGGPIRLVSCSIDLPQLQAMADTASPVVAADYRELLTWGPPPGRHRTQVTGWQEGRARIAPLTEADRELLAATDTTMRAPTLILDVTVGTALLPSDPTMRGSRNFGQFQGGAAQVVIPNIRRPQTVEAIWPSSWTSLAAVALSRSLSVRESQPGVAARTLIEAVGSIEQTQRFAHRKLVKLLYRMAEASGMSWWKRRWAITQRELRDAGVRQAELETAAARAGRDEPVIAPPGEGRAVPFQEFVKALDGNSKAAEQWVAWAEQRHLLVRGVNVKCAACKAPTWLPLGAVPPPVICAACGREIQDPYGPRQMQFSYRLGEPIRRVLETDSLGHVLTLRWLSQLFGPQALVGGHPGVEFVDPADGRVIGEVDVVLLTSAGALIPVEVKRNGAGATDENERSMDALAKSLDAHWDVLAVTEAARDLPSLAGRAGERAGLHRLVLSSDQLFQDRVFWAMGADPFAWNPIDQDEEARQSQTFSNSLAGMTVSEPYDFVDDHLLDPALKAYRHNDRIGQPSEEVEGEGKVDG